MSTDTHPTQTAGVVKPLTWKGDFAHTSIGMLYHAESLGEGGVLLEKIEGSAKWKSWWPDVAAAHEEAQSDFNGRVLSALTDAARSLLSKTEAEPTP